MRTYFSKTLIIILFAFSLLFPLGQALAWSFAGDTGLDTAAGETGHLNQKLFGRDSKLESGEAISSIIGSVLSFLGVVFLAVMIYGGILWMTARGNEQRVDKAKNLIIDAIVGLVIVTAAYAISYFVTNLLTTETNTLNLNQ